MSPRQNQWQRTSFETILGMEPNTLSWDSWGDIEFWYEGTPKLWSGEKGDPEYRTILWDARFEGLPEIPGWNIVGHYPMRETAPCRMTGDVTRRQAVLGPKYPRGKAAFCPLCESRLGSRHGAIYIGQGWTQGVYRRNNV